MTNSGEISAQWRSAIEPLVLGKYRENVEGVEGVEEESSLSWCCVGVVAVVMLCNVGFFSHRTCLA